MIERIWLESTLFEKIRVIFMFITFCVLLLMISRRCLHNTYVNQKDLENACADFDASYVKKFIIIDGEVSPICEKL